MHTHMILTPLTFIDFATYCPVARNDNLTIHEDKVKGIYVKGLRAIYVTSAEETMQVMRLGASSRVVSATSKRTRKNQTNRKNKTKQNKTKKHLKERYREI